MKQIIYVKRGVANSFDDRIEIHEKWKEYPLVERALIEHEQSHDSGSVTKKDIALDFKSFTGFKATQFLVFLTTPSMWWQLSPFYKSSYDNQWYLDHFALYFWAVIIGFIIFAIWI